MKKINSKIILHVKKLENPNFSDSNYEGKKLIIYMKHPLTDFPVEIYIGQVKKISSTGAEFYLKGFTMVDATIKSSSLEKQTILGREYCGRCPYYEHPLTKDKNEIVYEFKEDVDINELRDIADGKKQKLVIKRIKISKRN